MRTSRKRSRAVFAARVLAVVITMMIGPRLADAQTSVTTDAGSGYAKGTKTVTTSADGHTVTTTVRLTSEHPRLGHGETVETTVTKTDQNNNPVSETSTRTFHGTAWSTSNIRVRTYNPLGGYQETTDVTIDYAHAPSDPHKVVQTHTVVSADAAGNVVSGTQATTLVVSGGGEPNASSTTNMHWNATNKGWESNEGASLRPVQPDRATVADATEQIIAPPVSSPGKQMMVTYRDDKSSELTPLAYILRHAADQQTLDKHGVYYLDKVVPDPSVLSFYLNLPADALSVSVFKGFNADGKPDAHASVTTVSSDAPVPGMLNLPGAPLPAGQPAIVASSGAYDVRAGTITVQTQNTSIADALVLDTGDRLTTLAASDRSMVVALPNGIALGRHELTLEQLLAPQSVYPQTVPFDAISLVVDPMPPVEDVGQTATPTVHVMGMPPGDAAVMEFAVGGSAELAGGGTFTSVPVVGNVASCTIVGVRSGEALVRFHLRLVSMAATPQ